MRGTGLPVWHGTLDEFTDLRICLNQCSPGEQRDVLLDQRILDGLLFVRRQFDRFWRAEWRL